MKARDLAALAALGLGGAYLYNRNKGDATPKGADKPTAPADMNAGVGRRDASYAEDMNAGMGRRYAGDAEDMNAGMGRRGAGESDRGPVPNAMGVLDTEVYKRSEMDDLKGMRMPTRPSQKTSGMVKRPATAAAAAPFSSGRKPSVSQATLNKAKFKDFNFDPAYESSEIISDRTQDTLDKQLNDNKAEKKAAATAKSQEIIDRLSKRTRPYLTDEVGNNLKRGGAVKKMASGGKVSSASSRGDGIAQRGKTRGKMC